MFRRVYKFLSEQFDHFSRLQAAWALAGATVLSTISVLLAWLRNAPPDVLLVTGAAAFVVGGLVPRSVSEISGLARSWRNRRPIRAFIRVLYPQSFSTGEGTGPEMSFPVQIVNRESEALILSASFEVVADGETFDAYVVTLDGRLPGQAFSVQPHEPTNVTALVKRFMHPVPPEYRDRVRYPEHRTGSRDAKAKLCIVFTDLKTKRKAVVTNKDDYDVP